MSSYDYRNVAELMCKAKENQTPYTFITGAGCSISAKIPGAVELIHRIKTEYSTCVKDLTDNETNYGKFMACLDKDERRRLIRPLVDGATINWAHIALACLINAGFVQRVLTFNFDNILARACGLMGLYPATYDFTSANINLHRLIVEPAIVHLHGQSQGFEQLNDEQQTTEQANRLRVFMRDTMNHSPTLFIGYSGEADSFFDVIRECFEGEKRLFWLTYGQNADHHVQKLLDKAPRLAHHIGGQDADVFLIQLAQELEYFPPEILRNPYSHLLNELKPVNDYPKAVGDTDFLEQTKSQLTKDSKRMLMKKRRISVLFLEGKYEEVIQAYNKDPQESDKYDVAWAYVKQAEKKIDDKGDYIAAFELFELAVNIRSDIAEVWYNWGVALSKFAATLSEPERSAHYKEEIEKNAQALVIKPDMHQAWFNWGNILARFAAILNESERDIYYTEAERVLTQAESLNPDEVYNLACLYAMTNRIDEAREKLLHCKDKGTLPTAEYLKQDDDLAAVRDLPWFEELLY